MQFLHFTSTTLSQLTDSARNQLQVITQKCAIYAKLSIKCEKHVTTTQFGDFAFLNIFKL